MKLYFSDAKLKFLGFLLFLFSIASLLMVLERVISAFWQLYMFYGYETMGVITLSFRTGIVFFVSNSILIFSSHKVAQLSSQRGEMFMIKLARWAFFISCVSVTTYIALAMSPLNVWRP